MPHGAEGAAPGPLALGLVRQTEDGGDRLARHHDIGVGKGDAAAPLGIQRLQQRGLHRQRQIAVARTEPVGGEAPLGAEPGFKGGLQVVAGLLAGGAGAGAVITPNPEDGYGAQNTDALLTLFSPWADGFAGHDSRNAVSA